MQKLIAIVVCTIYLLAASCQQRPKGGPIQNTWWQLESYTTRGETMPVSKDKSVYLHFDEKNVNGKTPCNSFFANFYSEGVRLSFSNLASTERSCKESALEKTLLDLLRQTTKFSADEKTLLLLSDLGELHFRALSVSEVNSFLEKEKKERLLAAFDTIAAAPPIHLYPIIDVGKINEYPYAGQLIDTSLYSIFESTSADMWLESGGKAYAVGKIENFYLCRIPGRYASSDIALFVFRNEKLQRAETIAWAWCDEGWCNQQDAWLQDLNRDGKVDIIHHYQLKDNTGKVKEERISVMVQNEDASFVEDPTFSPDPALFELAKL